MVIVLSGGKPVRGLAACIDSYRDFTIEANVLRFEELAPAIDVSGDTAVASYDFEITYELGGTWTTDAATRSSSSHVRVADGGGLADTAPSNRA